MIDIYTELVTVMHKASSVCHARQQQLCLKLRFSCHRPFNSQYNAQTMLHSKENRQHAPAFSGDIACAMATLVTFQAPEMGILPGLALLLGMPCLIHDTSIICGYEEAWWVQQVAPLHRQQAADARHPPLIQRPACVPVRWPQTGGMFRQEQLCQGR